MVFLQQMRKMQLAKDICPKSTFFLWKRAFRCFTENIEIYCIAKRRLNSQVCRKYYTHFFVGLEIETPATCQSSVHSHHFNNLWNNDLFCALSPSPVALEVPDEYYWVLLHVEDHRQICTAGKNTFGDYLKGRFVIYVYFFIVVFFLYSQITCTFFLFASDLHP